MNSQKLNLFFWSPQALPSLGGLQNVVHLWAEELTQQGHRIVVGTKTPAGQEPDAKLYHYPVLRQPTFFQLIRAMRRAQAVVMFNVSLKQFPQWILSGRRLVVSHHTALRYDHTSLGILPRLKRWTSNTLAVAQCACSRYIATTYENCVVVPNPVAAFFFNEVPGPKRMDLLFAGRLCSDKGVDILIMALAVLKQRGFYPALTIAGDGPDRVALFHLAKSLGVEGQITFKGTVDAKALAELMRRYKVCVVPSRMEPFGLVSVEAQLSGCNVVLSKQGGLPETGVRNFFYFKAGSSESLATSIEKALSAVPEIVKGSDAAFQKFYPTISAKAFAQFIQPYVSARR